jgi:hypothetical protein
MRALCVGLAVLTHMRSGPLLLTVSVVLLVEVSLAGQVVRRVEVLAVSVAGVWPAAVGEVGAEDEEVSFATPNELMQSVPALGTALSVGLTGFELHRPPLVRIDPSGLDAVRRGIDRHIHLVTPIDDLQSTILHVGLVHGEQDGEVLHVLDVRIRRRIDVRSKATLQWNVVSITSLHLKIGIVLTTPCQLVVDLLLEQAHGLARELLEQPKKLLPPKEVIEAVVAVGVVLSPAKNMLAFSVDLLMQPSRRQ